MYDHKTAEDVELIKVSITAILDLRLAQSYIYMCWNLLINCRASRSSCRRRVKGSYILKESNANLLELTAGYPQSRIMSQTFLAHYGNPLFFYKQDRSERSFRNIRSLRVSHIACISTDKSGKVT